jgi:protocatechuate 3,4-dioxygenase beta subunit
MRLSRRHLLSLALTAPPVILLGCSDAEDAAPAPTATSGAASSSPAAPAATAATQSQAAASSTPVLAPTPACGDADDLTIAQTEGPYFTPNSPERASLVESGMQGTRLVVEGFVVSRSCQPVARALVDFWQCDNAGVYDNSGYRLRGHQFTDANGRYRLETIVPGLYPGRTRHIHVKVQAPGRPVLTTQLYFPGEAGNARDGIYNRALELDDYRDASSGKAGRFTFVLNIA